MISNEKSQTRLLHREVQDLTYNIDSIMYVLQYLRSHFIYINETSFTGNVISATTSISKWQNIFGTQFHQYILVNKLYNSKLVLHRAVNYSLPKHLSFHIEYIHDLSYLPLNTKFKTREKSFSNSKVGIQSNSDVLLGVTPNVLKRHYKIPLSLKGNKLGSQAFFGSMGQKYSPNDLADFQSYFGLVHQPVSGTLGVLDNFPTTTNNCGDFTCTEANLDVQYLMGVSQITPTYFAYYEDVGGFVDFNAWMSSLEALKDPPLVISISYGSNGDYPMGYFFHFEHLAILLAAKGVTLVAGSGDNGANGYIPSFPSTSQYVTSVGITQGPEYNLTEIVCSTKTGGTAISGGGFSTTENAPDWQKPFISEYFSSLNSSQVPIPGYNINGRGYPDIALLGHLYRYEVDGYQFYFGDGTSFSCPVFAGMVALVNAARLASGRSAIGWLNPSLYSNYKSIILNDITSGDNLCTQTGCGTQGFHASPGWYFSLISIHIRASNKFYYYFP